MMVEIMTIKSILPDVGWKHGYSSNLLGLVTNVHTLVSHTYFLSKIIFIQELENDDMFNIKEYVNNAFFIEVFLSLVDYTSRRNTTVGKTKRMRYDTEVYSGIQRTYIICTNKAENASQMAKYESVKISTAYINGLFLNFEKYVRILLKKEDDHSGKSKKQNTNSCIKN
ncbi:hypothetical protein MFLAVUS_001074 [Mucor flavus]|uniref:Uncharacterized protein n=1 Tax=Mucor flavus TaxID=439312 RepID=A0ABP9YLG8_9FUNG